MFITDHLNLWSINVPENNISISALLSADISWFIIEHEITYPALTLKLVDWRSGQFLHSILLDSRQKIGYHLPKSPNRNQMLNKVFSTLVLVLMFVAVAYARDVSVSNVFISGVDVIEDEFRLAHLIIQEFMILTYDDLTTIMTKGLERVSAVSPSGKLASTWADIKQ